MHIIKSSLVQIKRGDRKSRTDSIEREKEKERKHIYPHYWYNYGVTTSVVQKSACVLAGLSRTWMLQTNWRCSRFLLPSVLALIKVVPNKKKSNEILKIISNNKIITQTLYISYYISYFLDHLHTLDKFSCFYFVVVLFCFKDE